MATLEEQRRGIGQSITQSRQSSGGPVQPSRQSSEWIKQSSRGSMESMAARRRGEQVVDDIQRLSSTNKPESNKLEKLEPVGGISKGKGVGKPTGVGGGSNSSGSGLVGPLLEDASVQPSRVYFEDLSGESSEDFIVYSDDRVATFRIRQLKTIKMVDGGNNKFEMSFLRRTD